MKFLVQSIWDIFNDPTLLEPQKNLKPLNTDALLLKRSNLVQFFKTIKQHGNTQLIHTNQPGSILEIKAVNKMTNDDIENADHLLNSI